jgi:hypothetical protein
VVGASLSGVVRDQQGAPIPHASVAIKNTATAIVTTVTANGEGIYDAPNLIPGVYEITFSGPGFASRVESGLTLTVGATATLNSQLKIGNVTEVVQVDSTASNIELTSSQISQSVSGTEIRELPLNGRSWTDLVTLEPGVNHITTQQALATGGQTRGNRGFGDNFTIAGARPGQSNYRMDGVSMNDYANNGPGSAIGGNLGVDAIAEFSIISSNYSAEYGKTSGGVVNAISRSGTDQFHGGAYEFIRNSAVDARNYFDPVKIPAFKRNQFGASGGGPIRRGKTFVFGDYEGIRQSQGVSTLIFVPTAQARAGHLCSAPVGNACTPQTVTVDPTAAKFLPLYPLPSNVIASSNGDQGTLNLATNQTVAENFFTVRFDNKFSDKDSAFFSWQFDRTPFTVPDAFNDVINGDYTFRQLFILEETHTFSSNFVNTVRAGFNWEHTWANQPFGVTTPLAADPSLSGNGVSGPAGVTIGGGYSVFLGGLGTNNNDVEHWRSYQLYDDASLVRGKHALKIGGSLEILRLGHTNDSNTGKFSFPSLQAFLTNKPVNFQGLLPGAPIPQLDMQQALFGLYFQDDWRLRPNFTVNLGLRYEPVTVVSEKHGNISMLRNLTDASPHLGSPLYGNSTLRNFAPRIGLVWDPFGSGKTSVRSGFGVFDYLPLMALWTARQATLAPQTLTGGSSNAALLAGTFASGAAATLTPAALTAEITDVQPRRSYAMQWNFTVQQQLHNGITATLGYVGSHGNHLPVEEESVNMIIPTLVQGRYVNPVPVGSGSRPNTHFSKITGQFFNGKSIYNGLLSSLDAQVSHSLLIHGSFTYSKVIDIGSNTAFGDQFANANPSLPFFDLGHLGRGVSDFNVGKTLVVTSIYTLPVAKDLHGVGGVLVNGWKLGGIFNVSDGLPFTPTFGFGTDPLGTLSTTPVAIPDVDRTVAGCAHNFTNPGNHSHYIKTECFTLPKAPDMAFWNTYCDHTSKIYGSPAGPAPFPVCFNAYGNAPRNGMQGPGQVELDLSVYKTTPLSFREGASVEFRFEAFNILNHTNFAPPETSLGQADIFTNVGLPNSAAGVLSSTAGTSRQLQAAVKFSF